MYYSPRSFFLIRISTIEGRFLTKLLGYLCLYFTIYHVYNTVLGPNQRRFMTVFNFRVVTDFLAAENPFNRFFSSLFLVHSYRDI